jgi:Fanconi anemia group M protein
LERRYIQHPLLKPGSIEDRVYQRRILETARSKNTLVILPTALGKTVIAMLLALERIGEGKVLFMAPTRPLVQQHYDVFSSKTKLDKNELSLVTGRIPRQKRIQLYRSGRIVFATPQCVLNDLKAGVLSLDNFSLLVFDEAHRARGNYAYVNIASAYVRQCSKPLILGLTASPGGSEDKIMQICRSLGIEAVEYRSDDDPDVKPYIQPVEIQWFKVGLPEEYLKIRSRLREMLIEGVKHLQSLGVLTFKEPAFITRKDLIDLNREIEKRIGEGGGGYLYEIKIQATATLSIAHMIELIETQGPEVLKAFIDRTLIGMAEEGSRGHQYIVNHPLFAEAKIYMNQSLSLPNPKIEKLKELLTEQLTVNPKSRIIVFTQYRDTVNMILDRVKDMANVRAARFIGQGLRDGDPGMTQKQQYEVIQRLRSGDVNVLVATSIAEEGLDIPEVDHVIFYEPVPSEIRYIQRCGRTGRKVAGKVSIIMAEGTIDEAFYWSTITKVRKMRRIVKQINRKMQQIRKQMELKVEEKPLRPVDELTPKPAREKTRLFIPEYIETKGIGKALRWLMENLPAEPTPIEDIVKLATEAAGFSKAQVETAIWRLIQQGILYEPKPGVVAKP